MGFFFPIQIEKTILFECLRQINYSCSITLSSFDCQRSFSQFPDFFQIEIFRLVDGPGKVVVLRSAARKFTFHQFDELFECEGMHRIYVKRRISGGLWKSEDESGRRVGGKFLKRLY
jgi:hypothetical protein